MALTNGQLGGLEGEHGQCHRGEPPSAPSLHYLILFLFFILFCSSPLFYKGGVTLNRADRMNRAIGIWFYTGWLLGRVLEILVSNSARSIVPGKV